MHSNSLPFCEAETVRGGNRLQTPYSFDYRFHFRQNGSSVRVFGAAVEHCRSSSKACPRADVCDMRAHLDLGPCKVSSNSTVVHVMLKTHGSATIALRLIYFFSSRLLWIFGASWPHPGQCRPFSGRQGLTCGNSSPGRKIARDATCVGRNTSTVRARQTFKFC